MSDDIIRKHIQAALEEAVKDQKAKSYQMYDMMDKQLSEAKKQWCPIFEALNALKAEAGQIKGLSIQADKYAATIQIASLSYQERYKISADLIGEGFDVEECFDDFIGYPPYEYTHHYETADAVVSFVVNLIGRLIASKQVAAERMKRSI